MKRGPMRRAASPQRWPVRPGSAAAAALVDACRVEAATLLRGNAHIVRSLATELLIRRTLTGIEIDEVIARAIAIRAAEAERQRRVD
ncbi:hypothetical protein [Bradyrhizobium sp.]|jgi:hypothetical protein|uniref:hypothetical protein n=1 Tax=Bradyrhizobium sp. TaxID=376 RepID=UPI003BAF5E82